VLSSAFYKAEGHPYGSTAPYVTDAEGCPVFLFAGLATHYHNLELDPRASLTVFDEGMERDPLDSSRVTLIGRAEALPEQEWPAVQERYFERFPAARDFLEIGFVFFRLKPEQIHWIGGFGGAGWPMVSDYRVAGRSGAAA
jgi:putative heme iron utilization protein